MELCNMSASVLSRMMADGKCTSREITESVFKSIRKNEDTVGAYITLCEERALKTADDIDIRRRSGEKMPPLAGIPVAIKDNICTKGIKTTCASKMLENFIPPYDAGVVKKLCDGGLIIVGKTNMDEFAMGSSCENSAFKLTRNPFDTTRTAGGSSGGSAAALAAGEAILALGSDTGGSVRQPAAMCSVVGLKPTYGAVSRYGLVAFASSLDQIGPMARTAEDAALLFDVICGRDKLDATSADREYPCFADSLGRGVKGVRIGLPKEYFVEGISEEVQKSVLSAAKTLKEAGAELIEISLPLTGSALAAYHVISCAEASSNLARFDGVRYGFRAENCCNVNEIYTKSRSEGLGNEVKRRILTGTMILSSGYSDRFYNRAVSCKAAITSEFCDAFKKVDVILTPTSFETAFMLGERSDDPVRMYESDICTVSASLAGLPAMSVPCGMDKSGLPVGMQLMGNYFSEAMLFNVADCFEKLMDFSGGMSRGKRI